jgi:hypothetical protein
MLRTAGVALAALVACTPVSESPGGSPAADSLRVSLVEDYYWPSEASTSGGVAIDVFPLVTALVVESRSGRPLTAEDEAVSREAASAHCGAAGQVFAQSSNAHLSEGAWAFSPCQPSLT